MDLLHDARHRGRPRHRPPRPLPRGSRGPPGDPAGRPRRDAPSGPAAGRPGARARRSSASTPWRSPTQLAQRYHDHPALAMWHVSNEYACHNIPCYCDTCAPASGRGCASATATSTRLNDAWGTAVLEPALHRLGAGPAAAADADVRQPHPVSSTTQRFQSDTLLAIHRSENDVLNDLSPGVPVTTNFMTLDHFRPPRLPRSGRPSRTSSAPTTTSSARSTHPAAELAFSGDLTRGLAGGAPWLLMEHSTSAVNWQPVNRAKAPGQTVRDSLAHVARGADTHRLLPVAAVAGGGGEVPLRPGPARRRRHRAVPRGRAELGAARRPARRGRGLAASRPTSRSSGTTRPSGPRTVPRCRRSR